MPRKGENIYKRKDGRWEGRYIKNRSAEGKAVYGYVYAASYREVKNRLQDCLISLSAEPKEELQNAQNPEEGLFRNAAREWYFSIAPRVKESSLNKYRNLLNLHIEPMFGSTPLNQVTYDLLESGCRELLSTGGRNGAGLSPKTVADIMSVVRSILQFAVRNGAKVPCDGSAIRIKRDIKQMRVLSRWEQEQLCRYLYTDLSPYNMGILLCLFTGLRIGELCALRWEDISLTEQSIQIRRTIQRVQDVSKGSPKTKIIITPPKSVCSIRTIPIPSDLAQLLAEYRKSDTGYCLTNDEHYIDPRTMQSRFKSALKKSGVQDANFHALRHTFATRCVELGFDVKSLSEILGHASVNITMNRYVHPSMELKKENMQRLCALFAVG